MQTRPVTDYERPELPTHAILDEHPELLRLVPKRWQRNPVVLGALAGLCVIMSGCGKGGAKSPPSRVAPVFQHGVGRGGFGCVAINPPVLLSEDEARQIIIEEAKRGGLTLTPGGPTLPNVRMPGWVRPPKANYDRKMLPAKLDGQNRRHRIYFEFVSSRDAEDWQKPAPGTSRSVDTQKQARRLRYKIAERDPVGIYAVFYDPLVPTWKKGEGMFDMNTVTPYEVANAAATGQAQHELRAQARDFIKWLKAQGVI